MELLAHRTGQGFSKPNSLEGLERCAEAGIYGVECDVTFVQGTPFIWIDDVNNLLTTPVRSITDLTPEKVRALKRKDSPEGILEIEDVWNFMASYPKIHVYLDIKSYADAKWLRFLPIHPIDLTDLVGQFVSASEKITKAVLEKVAKPCPFKERIGFVTFPGAINLLKAVKKTFPEVAADLMVILPWPKSEKDFEFLDSVIIGWKNINHWKAFPNRLKTILELARQRGLKIRGGIANSPSEIAWMLENKFDGIWTDNIPETQKILANQRRTP